MCGCRRASGISGPHSAPPPNRGAAAQRNRRPCFRASDRLLWALLSRWWQHWRESLIIVQSETVLHWRGQGLLLIWGYRLRGRWRGGRPRIDNEIRQNDRPDGPRELSLGRTTHPRRATETRLLRIAGQRIALYVRSAPAGRHRRGEPSSTIKWRAAVRPHFRMGEAQPIHSLNRALISHDRRRADQRAAPIYSAGNYRWQGDRARCPSGSGTHLRAIRRWVRRAR